VLVLIDTNVIISATFWTGSPQALLHAVRNSEIICVTSDALLRELRDVLTDPAKPFGLNSREADDIVDAWRQLAVVVRPPSRFSVCRDEDDNRALECAVDGRAAYVITGDKDLLVLGEFRGITIVSVSDFLKLWGRSPETTG